MQDRKQYEESISELISKVLIGCDDLRIKPWKGSPFALSGHCYIAAEAAYHLLGGRYSKHLKPCFIRHEGEPHWYIQSRHGIIDPSAEQFESPVPYHKGKGKGFLTKGPSKRAQILISRVQVYYSHHVSPAL